MEIEVQQLVEMVGATPVQARAALSKYKDVMQAAERILEGAFDNVKDDKEDVEMCSPSASIDTPKRARMITPEDDEDEPLDGFDEADECDDEYMEEYYDSDDEPGSGAPKEASTADPYAGIFFSKDRREEVIEVEEEPEVVNISELADPVKLMTQGQWMKGCPEGSEQSFLFSMYQELSGGRCPCPYGCGTSIPRQKRDFFGLFPDFSKYIDLLKKIVPRDCPRCRKRFCYACGEAIQPGASEEDDLFHCSNLQGVILGVGLAMLEQSFIEEKQEACSTSCGGGLKPGKRRKVTPIPGVPADMDDDFDGLLPLQGKKARLGIGYAGEVREDHSGQIEAQAIQRAKDEKLADLLRDIRVYLPSIHREGGSKSSDYMVHPTTLAHLRRRFNFVSSQLLRNDSLADMSDRSVLYFELLEWLEIISCHEALASMMAMPIMVVSSVKAVAPRKGSSGSHIRERTIIYEGSSGPRELLEAIVIQAQAALKGLDPTLPAYANSEEMTEEQKRVTQDDKGKGKDIYKAVSDENIKLHGFCKRILSTAQAIDRSLRETKGDAFVDRLHASLPRIPGSTSDSGAHVAPRMAAGDSEEDVRKAYVDWANCVRFEYCDLTIPNTHTSDEESPHYKFYFSSEARLLANSNGAKRSLAIAKELAVLTTNLPVAWDSSIFLRVDETRVDVIKALITGPEGTPYHNGCYLFDIFLGSTYNQGPPSVKYMTTNGGKFRFNPNLYADGKVCLSLLGTWSGPGWISGKSTLLQVLISIQSMILCEEPYLNEPGWANSAGTPQSKAYSANVRRMVVRTAMLGNLKNPAEPFEDVICTHFRLKANSIMRQLDEWLAEDNGKPTNGEGGYISSKTTTGTSSNGFQEDIEELKVLLQKMQTDDKFIPSGSGRSSS